MDAQKLVALVALAWLTGGWLLMVRSIRRGRELAEQLARKHPDTYEALGRPRPGYLDSLRRERFARFVARRQFSELGDPVLAAEFEEYRRSEAWLVLGLVASLAAVGLLVLLVRRAG